MGLNERIQLAEWQGWKQHFNGWWSTPRVKGCATHGLDNPPDPFVNANDAYALIKHLNGLDYTTVITHHTNKTASAVLLHPNNDRIEWMGSNWMHGVCDLALRVWKETRLTELIDW